jgi:predicted TIM-barrel fold metal-dependent hydrolase
MVPDKLISADSHIVETPDWWAERVDRRYRDQVPRIVENEDGSGHTIINFPGLKPFPARGYIPNAVGQSGRETGGFWETPAGAFDPAKRLDDMALDGVSAEVLYPTIGIRTFTIESPELRGVCFKAHNDRMGDYVSHAPDRLLAISMIELDDIDAGLKELERCVKMGHRGAMISSSPPASRRYNDPRYDRFWAAASEMNIPISLHVLTGTGERRLNRALLGPQPLYFRLHYVFELQETLIEMIEGGVFERFHDLRVITVESGVGWMLGFATNADFAWLRHQSKLPQKPSHYVHRNIFATFQQDSGVAGNVAGGYANFMWASDYPHGDSIWPVSRQVIEKDFAGMAEADVRAITWDNAAKAYNVSLQ